MTTQTQHTQHTRTAMVDGREMEADKAASIHEVREIFDKLKKSMKQIALYRHMHERYLEYLEPVHTALADYLARKGALSLKVDATAFRFSNVIVFEDDNKDNNLCYPFWQRGLRLFIFKAGLAPQELLDFVLLTLDNGQHGVTEDILTRLWKAEFASIEYIVVEGFSVAPDEDIEEVEIEVDKVVAYLYQQLQSNNEDIMRFARVAMSDLELELEQVDQVRGAIVQGVTANATDKARAQSELSEEERRVMPKMAVILFQLLELDTDASTIGDVSEAFTQLLDALILQENFTAIGQMRERFAVSAQKPHLSEEARGFVHQCASHFESRMGESQRVQMIGQILNQSLAKDIDGVRAYLKALGDDAIIPLIDMLETIQLPQNRRLVSDILADMGKEHVSVFARRLDDPTSNLVKDMVYIIDAINPPEKLEIFATVLNHPNAILRLETLQVIGRRSGPESLAKLREVIGSHEDPQMRALAIRMLPNQNPEEVVPLLLGFVQEEEFERRPEAERKASFAALGQMHAPEIDKYLRSLLLTKGGLFNKRKVDDMKLYAISAYEAAPSIPALQFLAEIAKDSKTHSKEVNEAARAAALQMKARLLGV